MENVPGLASKPIFRKFVRDLSALVTMSSQNLYTAPVLECPSIGGGWFCLPPGSVR